MTLSIMWHLSNISASFLLSWESQKYWSYLSKISFILCCTLSSVWIWTKLQSAFSWLLHILSNTAYYLLLWKLWWSSNGQNTTETYIHKFYMWIMRIHVAAWIEIVTQPVLCYIGNGLGFQIIRILPHNFTQNLDWDLSSVYKTWQLLSTVQLI